MKNMAGNRECDRVLQEELERAGIAIVRGERRLDEVPATITGKLGPFTFERAWYYWRVKGPMPLDVARELYADPVGRQDVRVGGDCTCPDPSEQVTYYDADGFELVGDPDGKQAAEWAVWSAKYPETFAKERITFVPDAAAVAAKALVESYHIDSQAGLNLFAAIICAHRLHEGI